MIGLTGALVAVAVLAGIVLVLVVRPPARRLTRTLATSRADLAVRLGRLRALRRARAARTVEVPPDEPVPVIPSGAATGPSSIGGRGRHRRFDEAP